MMNNGGQSLFVLYTWITLNWPPLVVSLVHICKAIPFHLYYHLLYYHATFPLSTTCTLWFLSTDTHTHMYSISTCTCISYTHTHTSVSVAYMSVVAVLLLIFFLYSPPPVRRVYWCYSGQQSLPQVFICKLLPARAVFQFWPYMVKNCTCLICTCAITITIIIIIVLQQGGHYLYWGVR